MADYIVKDTELTSVANAIRTAGGTNSLLNFPNGFVSAVNNISGGGGSSDFSTATLTVNGAFSNGKVSAPVILSSPTGLSLFSLFGDVGSYDIVIYTGGTILYYDGSGAVSTSGNIQNVGNNTYLVTGNCTITIS